MILNVIRTIPSLLWALLAVVIVGSNPLAGVIALTFYSVGYLAKFFSETFEAANTDAQKALRSLGASPLQAFQYGLWPNARPIIWSHCLWMLEYNVRSASIIGYVGAGGIGLHLKLYAESADSWNKFSWSFFASLSLSPFWILPVKKSANPYATNSKAKTLYNKRKLQALTSCKVCPLKKFLFSIVFPGRRSRSWCRNKEIYRTLDSVGTLHPFQLS